MRNLQVDDFMENPRKLDDEIGYLNTLGGLKLDIMFQTLIFH